MKKFFTLIAVAAMALTASAQTAWWKADGTASVAASTLIDNADVKISTVYTTKGEAVEQTILGQDFAGYIQLRVAADPSATDKTGTEQANNTPIVIDAKKATKVTIYMRRQKGTNGYNDDDNKDLLCWDQAAAAKIAGTVNNKEYDDTEDYGFGAKTYSLEAGKSYTLYRKGSTVRVFGIAVGDVPTAVEAVAEAKAEKAAPVKVIGKNGIQIGNYNIAGQQVK